MRFTTRGRVAATAIVLTLSAGVLSACGTQPGESGEEKVLRLATPAAESFDVFGFIGDLQAQAVYDSLIITPVGGELQPWLAESFSYNEDHTVLTMQIRDDVDFTDGEHLDAEVVKLNLDLQRTEGDDVAAYSSIEDVVVTGEYTVEIRLNKASSEQLQWGPLRKPIVSPAAVEDREALATTPVGSGPYVLESNDSDASYTFVRNEDYWNPDAFPFDRIELTIMPDITARLNALKSGQVDYAQIDVQTAAEAESSGLEVYAYYDRWYGLMLGDRRGEIAPQIADVRVRRAIVMALDREGYANAVGAGLIDPSNQLGIPGQEGVYIPELADELAYDIDAARDLLAEAGYPDGFDIRIPTSATFLAQYQPYFEQAFADLGIRVDWALVPDDQWFDEYLGGKNAVVPFTGASRLVSQFVYEDGLFNPWHNLDAETAELIKTLDGSEGQEWLEARTRLTEKVFEEAWFAILAHEPSVWAFDLDINVVANELGGMMLIGIQLD